jgi:hypothetical protein
MKRPKKTKKNPPRDEGELNRVPCEFRQIQEWVSLPDLGGEKKRLGRYSGSIHRVPGFGQKKWVVLAYLEIPDLPLHMAQGTPEREILEGCVEFLNQPPPRRKYQRRNQKPLYGTLELLSYKFIDKGGDRVCCVTLVTNQKKNKNFWGAGQTAIGRINA